MYKMAINQTSKSIEYIPEEYQDEELCFNAIQKDNWWGDIYNIKKPSYRQFIYAIKLNANVLKLVKEPTYEMCLEAVKQNGGILQYIFEDGTAKFLKKNEPFTEDTKFKINELYNIALTGPRSFKLCIVWINDPTIEMLCNAINDNEDIYFSIINKKTTSGEKILTDAVNLILAKVNGNILKHIENQSEQLVIECVNQDPISIQYVKDVNMKNKLYHEALKSYKEKYKFFDDFSVQYKKILNANKSYDYQTKWFFENFDNDTLIKIINCYNNLRNIIFEKMGSYDYDLISPVFEIYNINYGSNCNFQSSYQFSELDYANEKLIDLIPFLDSTTRFNYMNNDVNALLHNDIKQLMITDQLNNIFDTDINGFNIIGEEVEYHNEEEDDTSNNLYIIEKHYKRSGIEYKQINYNRYLPRSDSW